MSVKESPDIKAPLRRLPAKGIADENSMPRLIARQFFGRAQDYGFGKEGGI